MLVVVNGEEHGVPDALTVAGLVDHLGLILGSVVVERNGEIVVRSEAPLTPLQAGDRLEVVRAVAGG